MVKFIKYYIWFLIVPLLIVFASFSILNVVNPNADLSFNRVLSLLYQAGNNLNGTILFDSLKSTLDFVSKCFNLVQVGDNVLTKVATLLLVLVPCAIAIVIALAFFGGIVVQFALEIVGIIISLV